MATEPNHRSRGPREFQILKLVTITLPAKWEWFAEDFDETTSRGTIFRCYDTDEGPDIGYLLVSDISGDPDEPVITGMTPAEAEQFDRRLEREAAKVMESQGRRLVKWMRSQLNVMGTMQGLVTAYIAEDDGQRRQYIDLRITSGDTKLVVSGCYDVARADEMARPIYAALREARVVMPSE